jgi:hypothetical protein
LVQLKLAILLSEEWDLLELELDKF